MRKTKTAPATRSQSISVADGATESGRKEEAGARPCRAEASAPLDGEIQFTTAAGSGANWNRHQAGRRSSGQAMAGGSGGVRLRSEVLRARTASPSRVTFQSAGSTAAERNAVHRKSKERLIRRTAVKPFSVHQVLRWVVRTEGVRRDEVGTRP
jgi:hypothetical protein